MTASNPVPQHAAIASSPSDGGQQHLPRVSFIVIAFNQEPFVQEAIDAAIAQDYENLQIILSDDNSTDRTYAIMQEAACRYSGPHAVITNRTAGGGGILAHFMSAVSLADGELVVAAGGDDLSCPSRVRRLVECWQKERTAIIFSAWNRVDVDRRFLGRDGIGPMNQNLAPFFPERATQSVLGCTAAYSATFLRSVPAPRRPIWAEDHMLAAVAMLTGESIAYVDEALVQYRQNPQALRNFAAGAVSLRAYEARERWFFDSLAGLLSSLLEMVDDSVPPARTAVNRAVIVRDIAWYRFRAD